ncbi:hypothetical protein [Streptacidiphilus rugosus]|uniref:hypothetical protein n=1 Tax=Streptacidiphilus rugosus TaxID=405783 RepID=UPI000566CA84|nr:hypothetical protein [Streptacidiphilus rugosus]
MLDGTFGVSPGGDPDQHRLPVGAVPCRLLVQGVAESAFVAEGFVVQGLVMRGFVGRGPVVRGFIVRGPLVPRPVVAPGLASVFHQRPSPA